jgi:hypothetical protein
LALQKTDFRLCSGKGVTYAHDFPSNIKNTDFIFWGGLKTAIPRPDPIYFPIPRPDPIYFPMGQRDRKQGFSTAPLTLITPLNWNSPHF